jgi:hypothetical protein
MNKNKKRIFTDFLASKMSFLGGMGSVFNLGGSYYNFNSSKSSIEADSKAILKDWQMVSQDFLDAFEKTGVEGERILRERKRILDA